VLRVFIFGHQGGWDEILMVVAPIAVIWVLLAIANRRAKIRNKNIDENLT
tara:strand:+ start:64 stop:213 length:150 start_codon:yes stop_codon:yes gene_type:complete